MGAGVGAGVSAGVGAGAGAAGAARLWGAAAVSSASLSASLRRRLGAMIGDEYTLQPWVTRCLLICGSGLFRVRSAAVRITKLACSRAEAELARAPAGCCARHVGCRAPRCDRRRRRPVHKPAAHAAARGRQLGDLSPAAVGLHAERCATRGVGERAALVVRTARAQRAALQRLGRRPPSQLRVWLARRLEARQHAAAAAGAASVPGAGRGDRPRVLLHLRDGA